MARPPICPLGAGRTAGAGSPRRWVGTTAYGSVMNWGDELASGPASRSRSADRAAATFHRRAGSFSSSPNRTVDRAPARTGGAGGSSTTACMVSIGSPLSNGGRPSTAV